MNSVPPKKNRRLSPRYWLYDLIWLTNGVPGLLFFRPKRIYENEAARKKIRGGALVITNHTGWFDPMYLMYAIWYRRHHFICTVDFFKSRARWFFERFLCIPIERENFGMNSFRTITSYLKEGYIVSMYPEGRIKKSEVDDIDAFKSGMILMAVKAGVPIVPVYIVKRKHWYSRLVCAIGEPIDLSARRPKSLSISGIDAAAKLLYEKETELKKLCEV